MAGSGTALAVAGAEMEAAAEHSTEHPGPSGGTQPIFAAGGEKHWCILKRSRQELISILT